MTTTNTLQRAHDAFHRHDWRETYGLLAAADRESPLKADDLERLALAAHMTAHDDESVVAWERAHTEWLRMGDVPRAARCAFWLAFPLMLSGEVSRGSGWLNRARRLLDEHGLDVVERGYLELPGAVVLQHQGDFTAALQVFERILGVARRFRDEQLRIMADLGIAAHLVRSGRTVEGFALLDELMVSVGAADVSPIAVGLLYCAAIECCQAGFDLHRAQEWTAGLGRWCEAQEGLVPYHRECLVHRSEILQLRGAWQDALQEARRAGELTSQSSVSGPALYQEAEIFRLRGEYARAEEAYRLCSRAGHPAQPGLALLRLAQGDVETAAAAIRVVLDQSRDPAERSRVLSAYVEVMLAAGDLEAARTAADELSALSAGLQAPLLNAVSQGTQGAVLLREGDARAALTALRRAFAEWQTIEAPYEAARTRILIALACRELGDFDTAGIELDAARWVFQKLGAAPELARTEALSPGTVSKKAGGLTERELEVLRLVASGKTNHAIATDLIVSEHTVRRHLQNIFTKLGVSSRSAATAFAFQHGLT